jgi:hypothetical protein
MFEKYIPQSHEERTDVEGSRALGWTSLAIGLTELLAPRQVESMLGLDDKPAHVGILRALGVRELMHGFGILTENEINHRLSTGVLARVAGDVLDTALLGVVATKTKRPASFAFAAASVLCIGLLDGFFAQRLLHHKDRWN